MKFNTETNKVKKYIYIYKMASIFFFMMPGCK